ncbi:MAG: bifunctional aldolase/short-chain dehydrogenase [Gammaproteobacteria bacterium]|nr:bifunctional aldolase/short-chain dehydrogenase [Gammaproteobacteria bacterium]
MKSRWNDDDAAYFQDPLSLRAYSSRLIGSDEDLVLHGGGNTSVKMPVADIFGENHEVLYVKGSGWDLADIEPAGFAPVKLDVLKRMAELEALSDTEMVRHQRASMLDPSAPNPSVEAVLHAIIPFRYVDHTHADAVVTLSNTPDGERLVREVFGERVLIVPYVMPGFMLARTIRSVTADTDWSSLEGMVLMNHGVFSFADDARESYERMIRLVDIAERHLESRHAGKVARSESPGEFDCLQLAALREWVSIAAGKPVLVRSDNSPEAVGFSELSNLEAIATRGPLTPDHVIRTKRVPLVIGEDLDEAISRYIDDYKHYFLDNTDGRQTCLDPAPRWGVWPGRGMVAFGGTVGEARIVADIARHTARAIQWGEALGGWRSLPEKDIFDVEYWELEQAKLNSGKTQPSLAGRIALVTGAGSGIGKACAAALLKRGAAVVAADVKGLDAPELDVPGVKAVRCDVTDAVQLQDLVATGVRAFGGLDIVVSNAGNFPASRSIEDMDDETWNGSLDLNLSSHQRLLRYAIPYLKHGMEPSVVIVGSRNVTAPGPEASAYSAAKAGLTQLARIAALELAGHGIRVNTIHPDAVFDTGLWSESVLRSRARSYGMSVEDYRAKNLLKAEVTAADVADVVCELAGRTFSKTTGAQIPVDGGNERVI